MSSRLALVLFLRRVDGATSAGERAIDVLVEAVGSNSDQSVDSSNRASRCEDESDSARLFRSLGRRLDACVVLAPGLNWVVRPGLAENVSKSLSMMLLRLERALSMREVARYAVDGFESGDSTRGSSRLSSGAVFVSFVPLNERSGVPSPVSSTRSSANTEISKRACASASVIECQEATTAQLQIETHQSQSFCRHPSLHSALHRQHHLPHLHDRSHHDHDRSWVSRHRCCCSQQRCRLNVEFLDCHQLDRCCSQPSRVS